MTRRSDFLSPFRYPGGKTWLMPSIRRWLTEMKSKPTHFIEPFAGGAGIGLSVAAEKLAEHVTLIERDDQVAAVWRTILYRDWEWLVERITRFEVTSESVQTELAKQPQSLEEKAFQALLRNRVSRGGILAPGAGILRKGEDDKGLSSRWYPETLKRRILGIVRLRGHITFLEGDGIEALRERANWPGTASFIDPPYTAGGKRAGSRLYRYHVLDHEELFQTVGTLKGDFLMTYSTDQQVYGLAQRYRFETKEVTMQNAHHTSMSELLISRRLDWVG